MTKDNADYLAAEKMNADLKQAVEYLKLSLKSLRDLNASNSLPAPIANFTKNLLQRGDDLVKSPDTVDNVNRMTDDINNAISLISEGQ